MAEALKITLPSALDAGVDFPKIGELRIAVTTITPDVLVRMNITVVNPTTIDIIGGSTRFYNSAGTIPQGTSANLTAGANILYFKPNGSFNFRIADKYSIQEIGNNLLFSSPTNSAIASTAISAEIDIKELKYSPITRMAASNVFVGDISDVTGTLTRFIAPASDKINGSLSVSAFNYSILEELTISSKNVTGDVSDIDFSNLSSLNLSGSEKLSGDIDASANMSNKLTALDISLTDISIDLQTISAITPGLTSLNLNGSLTEGDVSHLSDYTYGLGGLKGLKLSGDVSRLHDDVIFFSNANQATGKNKNSIFSTTYWTSKKPSRAYILALEHTRLNAGLDQFLIDMAELDLHPTAISGGSWFRSISLVGVRTPLSDTAVTTLQGKGVTVIINTY